jgi:hypothetical protein
VLKADPLGAVEQRVGQRQADGVRLGTGGRGADQAGPVGRQLVVGIDPPLPGVVVEADRPVLGGEAQRQADGVADVGEAFLIERAAERQEFRALHGDQQVAVGEPVREFGRCQVAEQLIAGDVTEDRYVRAGRA